MGCLPEKHRYTKGHIVAIVLFFGDAMYVCKTRPCVKRHTFWPRTEAWNVAEDASAAAFKVANRRLSVQILLVIPQWSLVCFRGQYCSVHSTASTGSNESDFPRWFTAIQQLQRCAAMTSARNIHFFSILRHLNSIVLLTLLHSHTGVLNSVFQLCFLSHIGGHFFFLQAGG